MEQQQQACKLFTKICLNNWHYIDHKTLTLNESINFFTGHSGSGKSTVIDAMQIVLYANTDGRAFFNKAAADDSDRSLIEYLRGMINIGENNQISYKRNQNFSTTIVLELQQSLTREKECIGVVFDVETATNEVGKLFFWHKGGLPAEEYRTADRAMTIAEIRQYLQKNYEKDAQFYTASNERFRRNLYDIYLGGLDMEKFPRLFKRAIPFRMNIRLEDFVKEYICMEQDIHIEDMQDSVVLYGKMCRKIEATMQEIGELQTIGKQYESYVEKQKQLAYRNYRLDKLRILQQKQELDKLQAQRKAWQEDVKAQKAGLEELQQKRDEMEKEYNDISTRLSDTGYALQEEKLKNLEEALVRLTRSEEKWKVLSEKLSSWEDVEIVSNQILWDIEKFQSGEMSAEEIGRLKKLLEEPEKEARSEQQEAASEARSIQKQIRLLTEELNALQAGKTSYPTELLGARAEIEKGLLEKCGKHIPVRILADLLDIKDEIWRNAIEGYLSWNKLALVVEPEYIKDAMEIYEKLDAGRYWRISLIDTEQLLQQEIKVKENSLAEEVIVREAYVKAFVDFLLGNVIKCNSVEELRQQKIGVTADCKLYQNYQLRRLNPDNYTRHAYIGEKSKQQRKKELSVKLDKLRQEWEKYHAAEEEAKRLLSHEFLKDSVEEYSHLLADVSEKRQKEKQQAKLLQKMEELSTGIVAQLKTERKETLDRQKALEAEMDKQKQQIWKREDAIQNNESNYLAKERELEAMQQRLKESQEDVQTFEAEMESRRNPRYEQLIAETGMEIEAAVRACEKEKAQLVDVRMEYLKNHPKRDFSASAEHNRDYQKLLDSLQSEDLEQFEQKAGEQAKAAIEHFKEDFIYKIRSAIREAYVRRDELNRIIRNLNFGKDKYQFRIGRKKGHDGEFYDMFMDENLSIDPSSLSESVEHQMNLFGMEHENKYGMLMSELIHIFIPPENATEAEREEAKRNMEKYADYRTYLSFEMEQIVEGEERIVIGLSKMIKKNSGGEGQNPLYIALLASFAQAYHINLTSKLTRRPTIRLVVLDEAFSKMDAEKVASCIDLIRSLGFQAIISATNDKIQNYIENVDKTFVYANPNKRSISIQEFERRDFSQLVTEE